MASRSMRVTPGIPLSPARAQVIAPPQYSSRMGCDLFALERMGVDRSAPLAYIIAMNVYWFDALGIATMLCRKVVEVVEIIRGDSFMRPTLRRVLLLSALAFSWSCGSGQKPPFEQVAVEQGAALCQDGHDNDGDGIID